MTEALIFRVKFRPEIEKAERDRCERKLREFKKIVETEADEDGKLTGLIVNFEDRLDMMAFCVSFGLPYPLEPVKDVLT